MFNITKLNPISKKINCILDSANHNITNDFSNPQALILRSFNMHEYEVPSNVIAIARAGAGVNNIPLDSMTKKGICVFNTPGANANAVKELVICALMIGSRKIVEGINWTQTLDINQSISKIVEKEKKAFIGQEIFGKTLGVVGLGAIGRMVANSAIALGMNVIGFDPFLDINGAVLLDPKVKLVCNASELYTKSDYITLHVPATCDTTNCINATTIESMKDGVVIINCAREELVNNKDIVSAVNCGKVGKYITDLPSNELIGKENIIMMPHIGASTPEAEDNCAIMASYQLKDYLENGNVVNSVNFPNLKLDRNSVNRAGVVMSSNSDIVQEISALLSKNNVKVTAITSAKKGDISYCIVEGDKAITACMLESDSTIKVNIL